MWEMVVSLVFSLACFPSCCSQGRGGDRGPSLCGMTQSRGNIRCAMPGGPDGSHLAAHLLLAALPCLLLSGVQPQSPWSNPGAASLLTYRFGLVF